MSNMKLMNTILVVFLLAIIFALIPMILLFTLKKIEHIKKAFSILLIFYCILIFIGVFSKVEIGEKIIVGFYKINKNSERFFNFSIVTHNYQDIVINLLMFIPFGFYVCSLFKKLAIIKTTCIGAVSSIFIESVQYFLPEVRSAQLTDIVLNTLSCLIGSIAYLLMFRLREIIRGKRELG